MTNSFLQSKSWEKFQNSVGNQTFRIDDILLIKKNLPMRKSYFYAPRVNCGLQIADCRLFFDKIKELEKKENAIFLKFEPIEELKIENFKLKIARSADVQPSKTIILDLEKSEEELLKNMRQKTRYNIRLAEKKGVEIRESNEVNDFWSLMEETMKRDGFLAYKKEYYSKMLKVDDKIATPSDSFQTRNDMSVKLYVAEYEGKVLAAGIFVFYGDTVTYLHGASTHEHKNVMAPYLLHWEMIKLAKSRGCKYYDFYGISEKKWHGVTRFKRGFARLDSARQGGEEINYPGAYDIIYSRFWYVLYKIFKKIRRII